MVQFAKYGPNVERIYKGRIVEAVPRSRGRSSSRSPRPRYRDDYRDRYYRRRSRSRSRERYERGRHYDRERHYHRGRSYSFSPDNDRDYGGSRMDDARRSSSHSFPSASPAQRSYSSGSTFPRRTPPSRDASLDERNSWGNLHLPVVFGACKSSRGCVVYGDEAWVEFHHSPLLCFAHCSRVNGEATSHALFGLHTSINMWNEAI